MALICVPNTRMSQVGLGQTIDVYNLTLRVRRIPLDRPAFSHSFLLAQCAVMTADPLEGVIVIVAVTPSVHHSRHLFP